MSEKNESMYDEKYSTIQTHTYTQRHTTTRSSRKKKRNRKKVPPHKFSMPSSILPSHLSDLCMCIKLSSSLLLAFAFSALSVCLFRYVLLLVQWLWFRCNHGMKNEGMKEQHCEMLIYEPKGYTKKTLATVAAASARTRTTMAAEPSAHDMLRLYIFFIFIIFRWMRDSVSHIHSYTHGFVQ